jgi:rubrerythrin
LSISFSGSELINIAIGIERRGIAFYDVMARSAEDGRLRDVFHYLVEVEHQHLHIFQDMLAAADKFTPQETFAGEYAAYFEALVDSAVFTDEVATSQMVTRLRGDIEALDLAIGLEKDSILFYYQMKDLTPPGIQRTLDRIISEEKSHLTDLARVKKELTAASS